MVEMDPAIERRMAAISRKWRFSGWLALVAVIGSAMLLALIAIGLARLAGWVANRDLVANLWLLTATLGALFLFGGSLVAATSKDDPRHLAYWHERTHPQLNDGLHALVDLDGSKDPKAEGYAERIGRGVLLALRAGPSRPFPPWRSARRSWLTFLALAFFAGWFHDRTGLWELPPRRAAAAKEAVSARDRLDLPDPTALNREQAIDPRWGEVRFLEPGRDLVADRAETVPARVEAAAAGPLASWSWRHSVNEGEAVDHPLPDPNGADSAASEFAIDPVALKLKDFDVLTYWAEAKAANGALFRSPSHRIEIRPSLEEIGRETGGPGTPEDRALAELTRLADLQRDLANRSADGDSGLDRPQSRLAARARALARDRRGAERRSLEEAARAMDRAATALKGDRAEEARAPQRDALRALLEARRALHERLAQDKTPRAPAPRPEALAKQLDEHIQTFDREAKRPGANLPSSLADRAESAKTTTAELEKQAESRPQGDPLREALDPEHRRAITQALDRLRSAAGGPKPDATAKPAAEARDALKAVAEALKGAPGAGPGDPGGEGDPLRPRGAEALERASRLATSIAGAEDLAPADEARQRGEALAQVRAGVSGPEGPDPKAPGASDRAQVVDRLDEQLREPGRPVDLGLIRELLDEARTRRDSGSGRPKGSEAPPTVHLDPAGWPARYRDPIASYYRALSESRDDRP